MHGAKNIQVNNLKSSAPLPYINVVRISGTNPKKYAVYDSSESLLNNVFTCTADDILNSYDTVYEYINFDLINN